MIQSQKNSEESSQSPSLVRLWVLRILMRLGGHKTFIQADGFSNTELAKALSLLDGADDEEKLDVASKRAMLRRLHRQAESEAHSAQLWPCLRQNLARLAALVGLTDIECRILEFLAAIKNDQSLEDALGFAGDLSTSKLFYTLSVVLDLPVAHVRDALSRKSALCYSSLVSIRHDCAAPLFDKAELVSSSFAQQLVSIPTDPLDLLNDMIGETSAPVLSLANYAHIQKSISILKPYLKHAVEAQRTGVNVFIYGPPGTGKSQLARVLCAELGYELFGVASQDPEGDPIDGSKRLRAYRAAQSLLASRQAFLVFDEAEDVFSGGNGFFSRPSVAQERKAWVNRVLEENVTPTFWISNSSSLDPAFIRRFDVVLELPVPPKRQREAHLVAEFGNLLDAPMLSRLSDIAELAPAVVARAATVAQCVAGEIPSLEGSGAIEHLIESTLKAQGYRLPPIRSPHQSAVSYDLSVLNADANLMDIRNGLERLQSARICLYGPPGTGKTLFGHWLADELAVPILVRRASDLLGKYVGESEKNIAEAFHRAQEDGAILLIDEVDSFLQDRRKAVRNWEISEVNEMLTQIEAFPGIFIASTNLREGMDEAALRRFDFKIRLGYLSSEKAWRLLVQYCRILAVARPASSLKSRLGRLTKLTPGDFAAVGRRHRVAPIATAKELVLALEKECELKKEGGEKSPIGFLQ